MTNHRRHRERRPSPDSLLLLLLGVVLLLLVGNGPLFAGHVRPNPTAPVASAAAGLDIGTDRPLPAPTVLSGRDSLAPAAPPTRKRLDRMPDRDAVAPAPVHLTEVPFASFRSQPDGRRLAIKMPGGILTTGPPSEPRMA